jgi:cell division protein FtsB
MSQYQYWNQLKKLEAEKSFYTKEIKTIKKDLNELNTNPIMLEKFAREKYLMKKENEDLFVIVNTSESK